MPVSRIAEAYVQVVPRIDGIGSQLNSQLSGELGKAGESGGDSMAKGVGKGMGAKIGNYIGPVVAGFAASFAAVGVANFFKDAVTGASDFAEQGAAVGEVFGVAASKIQDFADGAATSLGQSKTQVLEAAKQFGIYGKAAGMAGEENANFSTDLVKLATDLASFNNTSVDDAIMALGAGLRGESEPLRKFGVLITEAEMKAKGMEMGLGTMTKTAKGFTFTMNEQEKILARNGIIFEQTTTQQGDFERTSSGLANQQRILDANMKNLGITVGTLLLPAINGLVTIMNPFITFISDNAAPIAAFAATLGILTLAINAQSIALAISSSAWWANTLAVLANPITWIVLGIAALVAGIVYLATQTTFFTDMWEWMVGAVTAAWEWLWGILKPVFDFIGAAFKVLWDFFINPIITFILIAIALLAMVFEWLYKTVIKPVFDAIGKVFDWLWKNVIKPVADWISGAFEAIGSTISDVFGGIGKFIKDTFDGIVNIIRGPVNAIIDLINGMIDGLNKIKIKVPDWVPLIGGQTLGFNIPKIPKLAEGGYVDQPTTALIGEAGPEVVTPLKEFKKMVGIDGNNGNGQTINYYAAPNQSLDAEAALFTAIKRAKVVAGW
jgi:hypothetical protein